jgi:L-asparagine transporter-like permease
MLRTKRRARIGRGISSGGQPPARDNSRGTLSVSGLVLIGVGGIIGAGFFLGSGLPIRTAGPAVLLAFLFGAVINAQVTGALASLAIDDPVPGAFVTYTKTYLGSYAGFLEGWTYYIASVLTIASEAAAMAIFSHLWIKIVPLWVLTGVYALVVLAINAFGLKNFTRIESLMSVMKTGALAGFIVFMGAVLIGGPHLGLGTRTSVGAGHFFSGGFFPMGVSGLFQSMLIVIFAYAGVGVFSTAAAHMREPQAISRAAWITVGSLTTLYIGSIGVTLLVVPWRQISTSQSPFVMALLRSGFPALGDGLNLVILVASFSVMAGAVFAANQILRGLGDAHQAPSFVMLTNRPGTPAGALLVTTAGVAASVIVAYLLPANVYDFLISAASFLTFLSWFLILWAFLIWRGKKRDHGVHISSLAFGHPLSTFTVMAAILLMTGYALLQPEQRLGFYAFMALSVVVSIIYMAVRPARPAR